MMQTTSVKDTNLYEAELVFVQPIYEEEPYVNMEREEDLEDESCNLRFVKYSPLDEFPPSSHPCKWSHENLNQNRENCFNQTSFRRVMSQDTDKNNESSYKIHQILSRSASVDYKNDFKDKYKCGRRVSILVDELLLKIYGDRDVRCSSVGTDVNTLECSTDSSNNTLGIYNNNSLLLKKKKSFSGIPEEKCKKWNEIIRIRLMSKSVIELQTLKKSLENNVSCAGSQLIKQLKRRDLLLTRRDTQCSMITAFLQALSAKTSEDMKIQFSMRPTSGESGFQQWHEAMKMVARLSGGIPHEFRKTLWLTLAERHVASKNINWQRVERSCFNDTMNPDDEELGVQIVKDLHRTGCSLFCGTSAEENQAVLKRVLLAYARWNKSVGYCQGFNMLAALILEVMDRCEYDSLKVMIYLIEGVLPESYFANNLRGLSIDMAVFRDLLRIKLPKLSKHLERLQNDSNEMGGNVYEPPLTNVFTMQWFLTLFCNCLPHSTVLRVWDLIFLEGNRILLKTALAIWDALSDRIMPVTSADEFYCIMGVLTREMLEFGLTDANSLMKTVTSMELTELTELRERYIYNITPWTQVARKGLRLFYGDDEDWEEDSSSDDNPITPTLNEERRTTTAEGAYGFLKAATKHGSQSIRSISPSSILGTYSCSSGDDKEKKTLNISALKKQYSKIKERQRQAQIIFTAACNSNTFIGSMKSSSPTPAINHLMLNKNVSNEVSIPRSRRSGAPLRPPLQPLQTSRETSSKVKNKSVDGSSDSRGETVYWNNMKKKRKRRRTEINLSQNHTISSCDTLKKHPSDGSNPKDYASSSSSCSFESSSSSSSSTELCDEIVECDCEHAQSNSFTEYASFYRCREHSYTSSSVYEIPVDTKYSRPSKPVNENIIRISSDSHENDVQTTPDYSSLVDFESNEQQQPHQSSCDADRKRIFNLLLTTSIIASEQLTKREEKEELVECGCIVPANSAVPQLEKVSQQKRLNHFISNINKLSRTLSDTICSVHDSKVPQPSLPILSNLTSMGMVQRSLPERMVGNGYDENGINVECVLQHMKIDALEILFSATTVESIICNENNDKATVEVVAAAAVPSPPAIEFSFHEQQHTLTTPAIAYLQVDEKSERELKAIMQQNKELLKKVNQNYNTIYERSNDNKDCGVVIHKNASDSKLTFEPHNVPSDKRYSSIVFDLNSFQSETKLRSSESPLNSDELENEWPSRSSYEKPYKSLDSLNRKTGSNVKSNLAATHTKWMISLSADNLDLNVDPPVVFAMLPPSTLSDIPNSHLISTYEEDDAKIENHELFPKSKQAFRESRPEMLFCEVERLHNDVRSIINTNKCRYKFNVSSGFDYGFGTSERAFDGEQMPDDILNSTLTVRCGEQEMNINAAENDEDHFSMPNRPDVLDPYLHINFDTVASRKKKKHVSPAPSIQEYTIKKHILSQSYRSTELNRDPNLTPLLLKPHSRTPKELGIKLGLYSSSKK